MGVQALIKTLIATTALSSGLAVHGATSGKKGPTLPKVKETPDLKELTKSKTRETQRKYAGGRASTRMETSLR